MTLNYIEDPTCRYEAVLDQSLELYNQSVVTPTPPLRHVVYVFEDHRLVAGMTTSLGWDWVNLDAFFYETTDQLKLMIGDVCHAYKDKAVGIFMSSFVDFVIDDFLVAGFNALGEIKDIPKGRKKVGLALRDLAGFAKTSDRLTVSDTWLKAHDQAFREGLGAFIRRGDYDATLQDLCYVCLDDGAFVGGVLGFLRFDALYIDILFVKDDYRHQGIGRTLMHLIETAAKEKGYQKSYLGTETFQAVDFYQRLGYQTVYILENRPIGHENHTMVKSL